jgi:hypothetical protein
MPCQSIHSENNRKHTCPPITLFKKWYKQMHWQKTTCSFLSCNSHYWLSLYSNSRNSYFLLV